MRISSCTGESIRGARTRQSQNVEELYVMGVAVLEAKNDAPVGADGDGPEFLEETPADSRLTRLPPGHA